MTSRVSRPRLERIAASLDERSWRVVRILAEHRFATTNQLARLRQSHHKTAASALRQTTRLIRHLQTLSLVHHLERRIGGQRAGSTGLIWYLTEPGFRLLAINAERHTTTRHHNAEPSTRFLAHTLAVMEARVLAEETSQRRGVRLLRVNTEPLCWRSHLGIHGNPEWVKPDLEIVTQVEGYEDHWWLEIDLDTEHPKRLLVKAHAYLRHYQSGIEQNQHGVFPVIVWVTATSDRAGRIADLMAADPRLPEGMFATACLNDLQALLAPSPAVRASEGPENQGNPS
jgi:hypothetical protein